MYLLNAYFLADAKCVYVKLYYHTEICTKIYIQAYIFKV